MEAFYVMNKSVEPLAKILKEFRSGIAYVFLLLKVYIVRANA